MKKLLSKALAMALTVPVGLGLVSGISLTNAKAADSDRYVLMNIPYSAFYSSESDKAASIDTVSSATKAKTRAYDLAKGSYHSADGSAIYGITYPVKVPANVDLSKYTQVTDSDKLDITVTLRGKESTTSLTGSQVLFEKPDYSYYVLSSAPAYYKDLTVNADGSFAFGKSTGTHQKVSDVASSFTTDTHWGEYQLDINNEDFFKNIDTVYGVTLNTTDGSSYGMRDIQNIWRQNEIAWNGLNDADPDGGHDSSYKPYASLMGKTISTVTYYTDKGIYDLDITDTKVPVKTAKTVAADAVTVKSVKNTAKSAKISTKLPSDYKASFSVVSEDAKTGKYTKVKGFSVKNKTITLKSVKAGSYTLLTTDKSGKYNDIISTFTLTTSTLPVTLTKLNWGLKGTGAATAADVTNYIKNVTNVNVDGRDYSATAHRATIIVKEDGSIDTTTAPFADKKASYSITIQSAGYPDLTVSDAVLDDTTAAPSVWDATVSGVKSAKYTGKKITQKNLKVTLNGATLKKGTDYSVTYKNNKKKGTASVVISGKGDYTGNKVVTFKIK